MPSLQAVLIHNVIELVPITVKNPQVNAICEHFHVTIKNQLHTIFHINPAQDVGYMINVIDTSTIVTSTV
jgi:hypothetical protein